MTVGTRSLFCRRRAIKGLAVILPVDRNGLAHLVESRTKTRSYTVFENLFAVVSTVVEVICGKNGELFIVVSRIDDMGHRVSDPVGRLRSPEFVQDEHIDIKHGSKDAEFGRLRIDVV